MYKGQDCRLVIHYELGFSVLPAGEPPNSQPLFSYPFEKLRMSSDDGVRMLYLDFGGKEGEIVSLKKKKNPYLYILTTSFWGENFCHHVCHLSCGCVISNFYLKIKCLSFVLFTATGPALVSQAHCLHPSLLPFSKDRQTGLTGLKWTSELFNETHKQVHNWSQRRGQSMTRTKQNWNVWKSSKKKSSGEYPAVNFLFYFIFKKQWSDLSILEWNTINSTHSDYAKTKWSNSEWTLTCDQPYTQYYVLL